MKQPEKTSAPGAHLGRDSAGAGREDRGMWADASLFAPDCNTGKSSRRLRTFRSMIKSRRSARLEAEKLFKSMHTVEIVYKRKRTIEKPLLEVCDADR